MKLVPTWVTVWGNQLTHTKKSKIATKKPRKPKFSRLFGAARQIRTADLILTKDALYRLSYISISVPQKGNYFNSTSWDC